MTVSSTLHTNTTYHSTTPKRTKWISPALAQPSRKNRHSLVRHSLTSLFPPKQALPPSSSFIILHHNIIIHGLHSSLQRFPSFFYDRDHEIIRTTYPGLLLSTASTSLITIYTNSVRSSSILSLFLDGLIFSSLITSYFLDIYLHNP